MRIADYLPDLTVAEVDRCWMPPIDVCDLAAIGDLDRPEVRRFVNNVSDRGYIPFEKSGTSQTSPRHYSCISAIMLRTMREIVCSGRTYEFAALIAAHVADVARKMIETFHTLDEIDASEPDFLTLY